MIEEKLERIAGALEKIAEHLCNPVVEVKAPSEKKKTKKSKKKEEGTPTPAFYTQEAVGTTSTEQAPVAPTDSDLPPGIDALFPEEEVSVTPNDVREFAQKVVQTLKDGTDEQQKFINFVQNNVCVKYCPENERKLIKIHPQRAGAALADLKAWVNENASPDQAWNAL